MTNRIGKF